MKWLFSKYSSTDDFFKWIISLLFEKDYVLPSAPKAIKMDPSESDSFLGLMQALYISNKPLNLGNISKEDMVDFFKYMFGVMYSISTNPRDQLKRAEGLVSGPSELLHPLRSKAN